VFGYGLDQRLATENPVSGVRVRGPKKTRLREPDLTDAEAKTVLEATLKLPSRLSWACVVARKAPPLVLQSDASSSPRSSFRSTGASRSRTRVSAFSFELSDARPDAVNDGLGQRAREVRGELLHGAVERPRCRFNHLVDQAVCRRRADAGGP